MRFGAYVIVEVRDLKTGKLLHRRGFESESYVRAFIDLHYRFHTSVSWPVIDYNGVSRSNTPATQDWRMDHDSDAYPRSIVVGTGTTAVAITDYGLESVIAHGSGAGELEHQDASFVAPVTIGTRRRFFMLRTFLNQSGGAITVNETGIYTWGQGAGQGFCLVRDTVVPGEVVPDLSSITVQYEIFAEA